MGAAHGAPPMAARHRAHIADSGRGASSTLRVHEALTEMVVVNVAEAVERTGLTAPTVGALGVGGGRRAPVRRAHTL